MTTMNRLLFPGNVSFKHVTAVAEDEFLHIEPSRVKKWQAQDISGRTEMMPREIFNFSLVYQIPGSWEELVEEVKPNLPWAEDHFQERVGGQPLNPPPSEKYWPFAQQGNAAHKADEKFSHTYPERFWPKFANVGERTADNGRQVFVPHVGIRFGYGDLEDVIQQLINDPTTRQAYLPVWFPEDTGATSGQRVPCTLGYHFMVRGGKLLVTYYIRSCDYMRHFRDDVYMAVRLGQWVAHEISVGSTQGAEVIASVLTMHIANFHVFEGDVPELQRRQDEQKKALDSRLAQYL